MTLGATLARPDDTMESILERADKLLYQGKASGRNRVVTDF
jgi:PleD family two-component response regulator